MNKAEVLIAAGVDYSSAVQRFMNKEDLYLKYLFRLPDESCLKDCIAAYKAKDYSAAHNAAHTLKGIALNLNMPALAHACQCFVSCIRNKEYLDAKEALTVMVEKFTLICDAINEVKSAKF